MKYLCLFLVMLVTLPSLALSVCPDNDDLIHGINTQKRDFQKGKIIYLAGKYWLVEETQVFKRGKSCPRETFFDELACFAGDEKLKFLKVPFAKATCKFQIYVAKTRGVFGEFTLSPR